MKINKESINKIIEGLHGTSEKVHYIFGFNGAGKTQLGKTINNKESFVYNEDFVKKNIYIEKYTGENEHVTIQNANNKTYLFNLVLGINIAKEYKKKDRLIKEIQENNMNILSIFNKYDDVSSKFRKYFSMEFKNETEELAKRNICEYNVKLRKNYENIIKNLEDFDSYKMQLIHVNKKIDYLNDLVRMLIKFKKIDDLEKSYEVEEITLHKEAVEIMKGKDTFLFMGEKFNYKELLRYYKKISNKKSEILIFVKKKFTEINRINEELKSEYKDFIKQNYKEKAEFILNFDKNFLQKFIVNTDDIKISEIEKIEERNEDSLKGDLLKIMKNNWYSLFKNKKDAEDTCDLFRTKNKLEKDKSTNNKAITAKTKKITQEIMEEVNEILMFFGFDHIQINLISGSAQLKITSYSDKDDFLNFLSNGEKNIIAFSFFLYNLKEKIINNDDKELFIYIDDVFESTDFLRSRNFLSSKIFRGIRKDSYLSLKDMIINKKAKIIISTHDIFIFDSFISNLFNWNNESNGKKPLHIKDTKDNKISRVSLLKNSLADNKDEMIFELINITDSPLYVNNVLLIDLTKAIILNLVTNKKNEEEDYFYENIYFFLYFLNKISEDRYYRNELKIFISCNKYLFSQKDCKSKDEFPKLEQFLESDSSGNEIMFTNLNKYRTWKCKDIDNLIKNRDMFTDLTLSKVNINKSINKNFLKKIYGINFNSEVIENIITIYIYFLKSINNLIKVNGNYIEYLDNDKNKKEILNLRHSKNNLDNLMNFLYSLTYKK